MAFSDDLTTDLASVFFNTSEWAVTVSYAVAPDDSSGSESSSSIPAVPEANLGQVYMRSSRGNTELRAWYINSADVTLPKRGDTITYDSVVWEVVDVVRDEDYAGHFKVQTKCAQEIN